MRRIDQAIVLALLPTLAFAVSACGNLFGFSTTAWGLAGALAGACGYAGWRRCGWRLPMAFVACALLWGTFKLADSEWDGKAIHKPGAIALASGWNPVWKALPHRAEGDAGWAWCEYYPKAAWHVNAELLRATGNVDLGDGIPLIWAGVVFCLGLGVLPWLYGLGPKGTYLFSALLACNPVLLRELCSGYVDGQLGCSLVAGLLAFSAYARRPDGRLLLLSGLCCVYGANLKFTGLVYFGVGYALLGSVALWRHFKPSRLGWMAVLALATLLCGTAPYLTNWMRYGSPFYPLHAFSEDATLRNDEVLHQWLTPEGIETSRWRLAGESILNPVPDLNRFFSRRDIALVPPIPFKLALALTLAAVLIRRKGDLFSGSLLLTILIQPALWHFRYIPQLWALPLALAATERRLRRPVALLAACALITPAIELAQPLWTMTLRARELERTFGGNSYQWHASTSAYGHEQEFDTYWLNWLASAGIPHADRLASIPSDRPADFWCIDLRLYSAPPDKLPPPANPLAALLRLRARQLHWAWSR